jgi:hypothetical protein
MNELELLRSQLQAERQRAAEVAAACAASVQPPKTGMHGRPDSDELRKAGVEYLIFVLTRFEEREQMLVELYRARFADGDAIWRELQEITARAGTSREALVRLEAALAATAAAVTAAKGIGEEVRLPWQEFARFFSTAWTPRREALDILMARNTRAADWRAVAFVDADWLLEERARYSRFQSKASGGVGR